MEANLEGGGAVSGVSISPEGAHKLSETPVFRVKGANNTGYLRVMTANTYDGARWEGGFLGEPLSLEGEYDTRPLVIDEQYLIGAQAADIDAHPLTSFAPGFLPTSKYAVKGWFTVPVDYYEHELLFQSSMESYRPHHWMGIEPNLDLATLNSSSVSTNEAYLQLPDTIPERVRQLAQEVTEETGAETAYEKAKALEQFLKTTYTYDLDYENAPKGWEPSDWFLFEDRRGVCANFNHAFVVMARSLGLPARPVAGWAIAPIQEEQLVRAKQAHMWAELLFEGLGWVRFDATGAGGAPDRVREEYGLEQIADPTPTPTPPGEGELLENGVRADLEAGGVSLVPAIVPEGAHEASETPVFRIRGASNTGLLRVMTANTYDGTQWRGDFLEEPRGYQDGGNKIRQIVIEERFLAGGQSTRIEAIPLTSFAPGFLPTSKYAVETRFPVPVDYYEGELLFESSREFGDAYSWTGLEPVLNEPTLNSAAIPKEEIYLQLPDSITERVRRLAMEVTREAGAETPYETAKALEQYLKTNYTYDFGYANAPEGWEPSDWFLFEDRRGVCANFNHAFVVMARSLGLPARPVVGWAIAPIEEEQVVRAGQAHMWSEVLFESIGWVRFDATGAGGAPDRVREEFGLEVIDDPTQTPTPTPSGPAPEPLETITEITALDPSATKGGQFTVAGTVTDSQGRPVDGMSLEIFINETKEHGGILLGTGQSSNGTFEIVVQVPTDIPVGKYQVLAHALPLEGYLDSWSDPPIIIRSETETTLEGPDSVLVGSTGAFTGTLREESGEPLADHDVQLLIDGALVGTTQTSPEGEFSFEHTFTVSRETAVTAHFPGTELFHSSQAEHQLLVVVETTLTLEDPEEAYMEQPVRFSGELRDMFDSPIAEGEIVLLSAAEGEIGRAVTDEDGAFNIDHTFLEGGSYTIRAEFPGTTLLLPSSAEVAINVFINTLLTLEAPTIVNIDEPAVFTGTLTDTFDNGLEAQGIYMSVDGKAESLVSATTDALARYQWSSVFDEEGEHRIDASFPGEGLYLPSEAMAMVTVMVPTSIVLELPDYSLVHHETTLAGILRNSRVEELSGLPVSIWIDDLPSSTVTTDGDGRFSLQHTFTQTGSSQITAEFAGEGFLLPSKAEETLRVFTVAIETDVPDTMVRGETTTVGGRLTLDDAPLTGEPVTLLWDDQQVAEVTSQDDGDFSYDLAVDPSESLETHRITLSVPGFQEEAEVVVAVKAQTSLAIAGPLEGNPEDTLEFNATLLDDSGSPVPQLPVSLDEHAISGITDEEGVASLSYQVPQEMEAGPLSFIFRFEGTDQYLESEASVGVGIVLPPSRLWLWLTAVLVPTALLSLAGGYYLYRRRPRPTPSLEPVAPPESALEPVAAPAGRKRLATALYIELPQIVAPLPAVWGVGEPLEVRITLRDENQMPLPDHTVEVSLGDEHRELSTDSEGVYTLEHTFSRKGTVTVAATIQDDSEYKGTFRRVSVRIVDYREAVVQLYNDSLQELRRYGLQLRPESTPREVEHLVRRRWNSGSEVHVGQMVDCFEEADYSLHEIQRDNYVQMYLACSQLKQRREAADAVTV